MKKLIGITGGIGVGKTIVCKIFKTLGVAVFNADEAAKNIVNSDPILKTQIIELIGDEAYNETGYNKKYVANLVFNNKELLQKLNNLIHPKVREMAKTWFESQSDGTYYLYEAAIMKMPDKGNLFSKIIVVTAPKQLRLIRIKARDNRSESEIEAIISKQMSDEERLKVADFIITNDEKSSLIKQVINIHTKISQN